METEEVEHLKCRVSCAVVLEKAGFAIDVKESTSRAVKHRRGDAIVIVIHRGRGWFDPLSDAKGDVFSLIQRLDDVTFGEALVRAVGLIGFVPAEPVWTRLQRERESNMSIALRWQNRRKPCPDSATWRFLRDERCLPEAVLRDAIRQDRIREGPHGSMWAAHVDDNGIITGWEERGPEWRGYSTGGAKVLFRLGRTDAICLCVTEAAIDAMSLAALEGTRPDSLYLSTGGGWSPATAAAIRVLAGRTGALLVAATDNNRQGEVYAQRLMVIAREIGAGFERLRPVQVDWNAGLQAATVSDQEEREGAKEASGCRMPAGRLKGEARSAAPALDPAGRGGGRGGGVMKG